jgi:hypothetical protein
VYDQMAEPDQAQESERVYDQMADLGPVSEADPTEPTEADPEDPQGAAPARPAGVIESDDTAELTIEDHRIPDEQDESREANGNARSRRGSSVFQ